jgi:hypothetical protein
MYEIASIANLATMKFGDEAFFAKLMKAVRRSRPSFCLHIAPHS